MNGYKLYKKFIIHDFPIFRISQKNEYLFCVDKKCIECKVQAFCTINKHDAESIPTISEKEYKKELIEHPEYEL